MTKVQKKQIIGTILFILATIQIINFARFVFVSALKFLYT